MKHIVIDSSAFFKQPGILSLSSPEAKLVVTGSVLNELTNFPLTGSGISFLPAIEKAHENGTIQFSIVPEGESPRQETPKLAFTQSLSGSNRRFLTDALAYKAAHGDTEFALATDDKTIAEYAKSIGIETIKSSKLGAILSKGGSVVDAIAQLVNKATHSQLLWFVLNLAIAAFLVCFADWLSSRLHPLLKILEFGWSLAAILVTGFLFYLLRSYFRQAYGLTEIFVGVWVCLRLFPLPPLESTSPPTMMLQLLGGLYIIVRGIENFGRGLRGTRFYPYISWIFNEDRSNFSR